MITQEYLKELFDYKDGNLYWKINKGSRVKSGQKAGYVTKNKYTQVRINNQLYYAHRLIYLFHHNLLPVYIDHKDGNPLNNCIENLRQANAYQNGQNKEKSKYNKSGHKNISWDKENNKWVVRITVNNKSKNFGRYKDIDYAIFVADFIRNKFHGEFARK
jgi:hypothetical protein